jgi:hypothetical protein
MGPRLLSLLRGSRLHDSILLPERGSVRVHASPQLSHQARAWALFCQITEQLKRIHGLILRPTSFLRTAAEQKALFDQKLTTCDGTTRRSSHQDGRALDAVLEKDGVTLPLEHPAYDLMGALWLSLDPRNVWGGAWIMPNGKPDKVHLEFRP